jgi:type VI protein secretion system component Hcp
MSDEIKKPEVVNAGEEKQLDENVLDQVVGGDSASPNLFAAVCTGKHIDKAIIE